MGYSRSFSPDCILSSPPLSAHPPPLPPALAVLHWHIVDDQSFPYMSRTFPELSRAGAFSPSHVYSVEDIQKVQTYARDRGIRVIPEFDTPGHVTRGLNALNPPVLTDCYDASGKVKGTGPLNPTINATYDFMTKFMAEVKQVFWDQVRPYPSLLLPTYPCLFCCLYRSSCPLLSPLFLSHSNSLSLSHVHPLSTCTSAATR